MMGSVDVIDMWAKLYLLVHNDTDSIVEQALAEDDCVELGVDLVLVEDGKNGHWISRRQCRAESKTLNERQIERL